MAGDQRGDAEPFGEVVTLDLDDGPPQFTATRGTLVVFAADGLPVGQQWLGAGVAAIVPGDVAARIAARRRSPPAAAPDVATSVIICTRDRPEQLRRCLASFAMQTRRPDEIIVVDNASVGPQTREVVAAAGMTYLREDRPGLDFARNRGAVAAHGDIVLYTDDDTELHPRWIEHTIRAFDAPEIVAVTGLVLPAALKTEAQWIFERDWSFGRGFDRIDFGQEFYRATRAHGSPAWIIGAGANMAFRRSIFDEIGYFDERLDVGQAGCSGDSEYWYRILAAGRVCRYEPTAVMHHHHRVDRDGAREPDLPLHARAYRGADGAVPAHRRPRQLAPRIHFDAGLLCKASEASTAGRTKTVQSLPRRTDQGSARGPVVLRQELAAQTRADEADRHTLKWLAIRLSQVSRPG